MLIQTKISVYIYYTIMVCRWILKRLEALMRNAHCGSGAVFRACYTQSHSVCVGVWLHPQQSCRVLLTVHHTLLTNGEEFQPYSLAIWI